MHDVSAAAAAAAVRVRVFLDDHRVQRPDDQVDGERGRQQGGPRRMTGTEPEHGRKGSQQTDGYLRAGTVSPLYGGRMFACNVYEETTNETNAVFFLSLSKIEPRPAFDTF